MGTHDISILSIDDGVFEVLATGGDGHLGGEDMDNELMKYCAEEFRKRNKLDISTNQRALRRLKTACERAKRTLSTTSSTQIEIDSLMDGVDFTFTLTRAKFESLCSPIFARAMRPVEQCLRDAKLSKTDIDDIVLVGGTSRIPKLQEMLRDYFGGKELNKSINPDECVAAGAATNAFILSGGKSEKTDNIVVCDVAPLSIGVETAGGIMTPIVTRNTTIPTKKSKVFSTFSDNQTRVNIMIYEGERARTADNRLLGQFHLDGIPPAPRGIPQIEVSLDIDANGILNVSAVEKGTGKNHKITITNDKGRLSKEEINRMVEQSERFAAEDAALRERVEERNKLESYLLTISRSAADTEARAKLSEEDVSSLAKIAADGLKWLDDTGATAEASIYDAKYKEIEATIKPIMMRLYASGGGSPPDVTSPKGAGAAADDVD